MRTPRARSVEPVKTKDPRQENDRTMNAKTIGPSVLDIKAEPQETKPLRAPKSFLTRFFFTMETIIDRLAPMQKPQSSLYVRINAKSLDKDVRIDNTPATINSGPKRIFLFPRRSARIPKAMEENALVHQIEELRTEYWDTDIPSSFIITSEI